MTKLNLYWPVYKNLEKEFLKISEYIHFSDNQTNVYSMHIADLIVRCAIEIEAISKELYYDLGGNPKPLDSNGNERTLYFDTDCLDELENKWNLSKKKIIVSAPTFYFLNDENKILNPLHKVNRQGSSGSKWKQAYQAVKHNRKDSLDKANIKNLLNAMGALYILNLYYKNEKFNLGRVYMGNNEFDDRIGSDIFSVFSFKATSLSMTNEMDDRSIYCNDISEVNSSIYIVKYDDDSFREMAEDHYEDSKITLQNFNNSIEIKNFFDTNTNYEFTTINKACMDAGGTELLGRIFSFKHQRNNNDIKTEAIINKNTNIYIPIKFNLNENI